MNKTIFIGRLTKDVEYNEEKKYARFTLALNERAGDKKIPLYINHIAFGSLAELAKKYLKKGSKVLVEGKFTQNQEKREQISFIAEKIEFLDPKDKTQENGDFPF
ncbi:single-stranded DNA-binding protein [uncultured Fusobacterium sp.]|uniref:single-stranded DNA-binding protein n=1 Tax=uncultured Fusobacterium sp. TaxID=159267 RepID=UPI0027DDA018|nr:single-stranded DNA-binding protein [uncultured Fusobacterium sp.]